MTNENNTCFAIITYSEVVEKQQLSKEYVYWTTTCGLVSAILFFLSVLFTWEFLHNIRTIFLNGFIHPQKKADDKTADKITFNNTLVVLVVFRVEGDETQNLQKVFVFDFFLLHNYVIAGWKRFMPADMLSGCFKQEAHEEWIIQQMWFFLFWLQKSKASVTKYCA